RRTAMRCMARCLPWAIPATLHDALLARLDRLAAAKVVAHLGATIGRTFAYDVVQAVAPLDEGALQGALTQLVEAEIVAQRGLTPQATYTFKHALIQDAAYQSLLRSTRQQYHQRIAQVLAEHFPRRQRHSPKCWRSTTPPPVCMPRPCPIGSRPGNSP